MKAILRSAVLAASLAAGLAISTTPASAAPAGPGVVVFSGTAHINCFGCGTSTGTASLSGTGVFLGAGTSNPVSGTATADYSVAEGTGVTCVITGSASGSVTGFLNLTFTWLRVGAVAVITTAGDLNGAGVAGFAVTSPVGIPCGGPVDADFAGVVAGT